MSATKTELRAAVLAALEQACRYGFADHRGITNDAQAVNWGPYSGDLRYYMHKAGILFRYSQVRRILAEEVAAGRVLRASPHSNVVRFWPVGLWDKLQAERAAQKLCATCQGEGVIHTGILEAPVTQCRKCDGDGMAQKGGAK